MSLCRKVLDFMRIMLIVILSTIYKDLDFNHFQLRCSAWSRGGDRRKALDRGGGAGGYNMIMLVTMMENMFMTIMIPILPGQGFIHIGWKTRWPRYSWNIFSHYPHRRGWSHFSQYTQKSCNIMISASHSSKLTTVLISGGGCWVVQVSSW